MSSPTEKPPDTSGRDNKHPTPLSELMKRRPFMFALAFESGLGLVAIVLALIFGLRPWLTVDFESDTLLQSVLATAPLVAAVLALMQLRWRWVKNLDRIVRQQLLPLFHDAGPMAVLGVALIAGIGEELLFRGVIQDGLVKPLGPIIALAIASLLFGMAHAITPAYFVLTCLMGLYLGSLYQLSGNLLLPILVHFLYDWVVLAWYLFGRSMR